MEEIIKEGALRVLTTEASCDVILSCQGYRLMAHKVILSIASPFLQNLLLQDIEQPSVLIFPDISGNTMSLILDYVYTGSVNVNSKILADFISAANFLKLQLDTNFLNNYPKCLVKENKEENVRQCKKVDSDENFDLMTKTENIKNAIKYDGKNTLPKLKYNFPDVRPSLKKTPRKMPNLIPISSFRSKKGLYNQVTPSPWCPRLAPLLADPRNDHTTNQKIPSNPTDALVEQNDTNNNFQIFRKTSCQSYLNETEPNTNLPAQIDDESTSERSPLLLRRLRKNDNEKTPKNVPLNLKKKKIDPLNSHLEKVAPQIVDHSEDSLSSRASSPRNVETVVDDLNDEISKNNDASQNIDRLKPFVCEDCGKSFSQLRNFKYHRSIHEGTKEFAARCPECGKTFNDKGYLSSHMKIHRDRKEYGCPHCPKRFNQRVAYNMHLRIHTGVKPHECSTCGKTFSRKMLLKQHQRVHTGERPYSCPECGKSFADRSNMSLHARLHTGVKPYACNLCSKTFTKKHHLKTHMNFHTGLKPYSCQQCGLSFSQSSNMRTHYKKCILKSANAQGTEYT